MDLIEKLIGVGLAILIYFAFFSAMVTNIQLTNWTALSLTWVPTILYILLAILPVIGILGYLKFKKG